MEMVLTTERMLAVKIPGKDNGTKTLNIVFIRLAPSIFAADSRFVPICSMKGVKTRIIKGTMGTRFAIMTPVILAANLILYKTIANGIP